MNTHGSGIRVWKEANSVPGSECQASAETGMQRMTSRSFAQQETIDLVVSSGIATIFGICKT